MKPLWAWPGPSPTLVQQGSSDSHRFQQASPQP